MIDLKHGALATLLATPSVPDHREVARETLRTLVRSTGLRDEAFASKL